jgi:hypothetical protein
MMQAEFVLWYQARRMWMEKKLLRQPFLIQRSRKYHLFTSASKPGQGALSFTVVSDLMFRLTPVLYLNCCHGCALSLIRSHLSS